MNLYRDLLIVVLLAATQSPASQMTLDAKLASVLSSSKDTIKKSSSWSEKEKTYTALLKDLKGPDYFFKVPKNPTPKFKDEFGKFRFKVNLLVTYLEMLDLQALKQQKCSDQINRLAASENIQNDEQKSTEFIAVEDLANAFCK